MAALLDRFTPQNVTKNGNRYLFPADGGSLDLTLEEPGRLDGVPLTEDKWLSMDLTVHGTRSVGILWKFAIDGETDDRFHIKMGLLPRLTTRVALPLSVLSGNTLFLPRTPGKLKSVVFGHSLPLSRITRFSLAMDRAPEEVDLQIENVCLLAHAPAFPLENRPMVDALGQKYGADWPGKTKDLDALRTVLQEEEADREETPLADRSHYGGWTKKRFDDGTGYFALHHDGRRYWLKDPDGYAFFSMGFDCICLGDNCNLTGICGLCENLPPEGTVGWSHHPWHGKTMDNFNFFAHNFYTVFGENYYDIWADMTKRRLVNWGCNTVACWSEKAFIAREKLPYVVIGPGYPQTARTIFRDFPDVYSPEFAENAEKWAHFLDPVRSDPYLIGYFLSNEPAWAFVNGIDLAAMCLASPEPLYTKDVIVTRLAEKYGVIERLNEKWGTSFASFDALRTPFAVPESAAEDLTPINADMIRTYIRIPSEAARQADPHHLNLGIRYAWLSSPLLASGCEYTDVFSFNCYRMDPTSDIERFAQLTGKPVIIGEFHFGALDRGMDATGLRGVTSQAERGVAYRRYMHKAAAHPMCLGAHYFTLYDQAYLGRFDGENYQIGVLDVCSQPYTEFLDGIIRTHGELYEVADGTMAPTEEIAKEIPAIAF